MAEALETADHEIARLQAQIAEHYESETALNLTMEIVTNLSDNWTQADGEIRPSFAHSVCEHLVYDLDARQIVDIKLTPLAERLMQLKLALDDDEKRPSESDEIERVLWRPHGDLVSHLYQDRKQQCVPSPIIFEPVHRHRRFWQWAQNNL